MRAAWALMAILLLVSGCAAPASPAAKDRSVDRIVVRDPNDYSYLFGATNASHVHDYWGGQPTIKIVDGSKSVGPTVNMGGKVSTSFEPPNGASVIPGTRWINVSIRLEDRSKGSVDMQFVYRTANGEQGRMPIVSGKNLTIDSSDARNDPPHSRFSGWVFEIEFSTPLTSAAVLDATIHLAAEIVRGPDPIPLFPAHPDPWAANTTLVAYEARGRVGHVGPVAVAGTPFSSLPPRSIQLRPVVPLTETMRVQVFYNSSTPTETHYDPKISFHGADKRSGSMGARAPAQSRVAQTNGFWSWSVDVLPEMWDSPYANVSAWGFSFLWEAQLNYQNIVNMGRPVAMQGDYHILITIVRQSDSKS